MPLTLINRFATISVIFNVNSDGWIWAVTPGGRRFPAQHKLTMNLTQWDGRKTKLWAWGKGLFVANGSVSLSLCSFPSALLQSPSSVPPVAVYAPLFSHLHPFLWEELHWGRGSPVTRRCLTSYAPGTEGRKAPCPRPAVLWQTGGSITLICKQALICISLWRPGRKLWLKTSIYPKRAFPKNWGHWYQPKRASNGQLWNNLSNIVNNDNNRL